MDDVAKARATLSELRGKLAELDRRSIEFEQEAQRLSLPALTGDAAARKRLDLLSRERVAHEIENRNVKAATRAQEALLAEAERAGAKASERAARLAKGQETASRLKAAGQRGQRIGTLARELRDEIIAAYSEDSSLMAAGRPCLTNGSSRWL